MNYPGIHSKARQTFSTEKPALTNVLVKPDFMFRSGPQMINALMSSHPTAPRVCGTEKSKRNTGVYPNSHRERGGTTRWAGHTHTVE